MDASDESWHRLFFIYFFFCVSAPSTFFLVATAASTPQEKKTGIDALLPVFFSKEKRARLHRLSQNGNPYNLLWSERKKTESCQGGL